MRSALLKVFAVPLMIVAIPLAAIAALVSAVFGLKEKRTAQDVTTYLRQFIEGSGGEWDWDDFTSLPIADSRLENIRRKAAAVQLPVTQEGDTLLRVLLAETEELVKVGERADAE